MKGPNNYGAGRPPRERSLGRAKVSIVWHDLSSIRGATWHGIDRMNFADINASGAPVFDEHSVDP